MAYEGMLSLDQQIRGEKSEQKYIDTEVPLAYFQLSRMARDMRSGKTDAGSQPPFMVLNPPSPTGALPACQAGT